MAKRARTVHVFDGWADVPDYDGGHTIVGHNARWTSLRPKKAETWDSLPVSKLLGVPVFDMWFDDKEGIVARLHQHGLVVGVFTLPDELPGAHSATDLADALAIQEVLTTKEAKALKKEAMGTPAAFAKWTFAHGLEKLLGLPDTTKPVKAAKKTAAPPTKKKTAPPAKKKASAKPVKKKASAKPVKKAAAKPAKKVAKAPAKKKAAPKPKTKAKTSPRKLR